MYVCMYVCIHLVRKKITITPITFLEKDFTCKQKHNIYEIYYLIPFT